MRRTRFMLTFFLVTVVSIVAAAQFAAAAVRTDTSALRDAVTVRGILKHERAFQAIADANGDTRASGTPGYDESVEYVQKKLKAAGYNVTVQPFEYELFIEQGEPVLDPTSPDLPAYTAGEDFATMDYSGSGDVSAPLQAAGGITIPSPGGSTSGCSPDDFAGFEAGSIALIQRGTCPFRQKVENAQAAGAAGVVIFNEGNVVPDDDRVGLLFGTLDPPQVDIPVVGTSFAVGEELYGLLQEGPVSLRLAVDAVVETRDTSNVIAESKRGRSDRVVFSGAHLDSVPEGPGINDNGSGTATILEVAEEMAELKIKPRNKVRFAFWGAEESGLIGSEFYVSQLTKRQQKNIAIYLNYDMVGSPNYGRFIYDGDGDAFGTEGPNGSANAERIFERYFASQGLATLPTAFDGRSDYGPFIDAGIPAGGLFTGAEDIKTAEDAALFGGVADAAFDPCYHQACDSLTPIEDGAEAALYEQINDAYDGALEVDGEISNLNKKALDEMSDAVAHATLTFAQTRSSVNGTARASTLASPDFAFKGSHAVR